MGIQQIIRKCFGPAFDAIVNFIGKIEWKQRHPILAEDKAKIRELLEKDYYIIVTRRGNHLSTYAIALGNFLISGKFSFYSHVLMNLEDEIKGDDDFRFAEAIGAGSKYSNFGEVFGSNDGKEPDAVALMKPKSMTIEEWTAVLDKAKTQIGKPYDSLFDLTNDQKVSCVELVRNALMGSPNYSTEFANFEAMISKAKNLTPQMFRNCPDFEVVYEIKR